MYTLQREPPPFLRHTACRWLRCARSPARTAAAGADHLSPASGRLVERRSRRARRLDNTRGILGCVRGRIAEWLSSSVAVLPESARRPGPGPRHRTHTQPHSGAVAQQGERSACIREAASSILAGSTNFSAAVAQRQCSPLVRRRLLVRLRPAAPRRARAHGAPPVSKTGAP